MKVNSTNFLFGIFLILLGIFFILGTAYDIRLADAYVVALVFLSVGIVLLLAYFVFRHKVWALILGTVSLFLASSIFIHESRVLPDEAIGSVMFLLAGLLFLSALRSGKKNWWSIIPAGFCFTFAAQILISFLWRFGDRFQGVAFFVGSGIIFGILYLIRDESYKLDWAKYPSIISWIMSLIVLLTVEAGDFLGRLILPLLLMGIGALILRKSLREPVAKRHSGIEIPEEPVKEPRAGKARKTKSGTSR